MGRGNSHQGTTLGEFTGSPLPLCPLSAPPVCYIAALVLSCSLTSLMLIRSLVTHRSVAGSDPRCRCGEEVREPWARRPVGQALGLDEGRATAGPGCPWVPSDQLLRGGWRR